jgi:hypothetical protein
MDRMLMKADHLTSVVNEQENKKITTESELPSDS